MKQKILVYFVPAVLGFSLLGANVVSAHGLWGGMTNLSSDEIANREQAMFQNEANLLGISVDEIKNGWAQGKTLQQIATDHNITPDQLKQKMKDAQLNQIKTQLQALVNKGIVTQAQADQRLSVMQGLLQNGKGHMGRRLPGRFRF
jgi:hypothetical protein